MAEDKKNNQENIHETDIATEFRSSFLEYAMSVIVARALPDARDGLKPVQRRIIYTMYLLGMFYKTPFKKSARIVGEVMGKFHPHGDSSIYYAMVRMAQTFTTRFPLIIGHGNFGSIDGDNPAAMRYTEAKLSKLAEEMTGDLNKEAVDFSYNYDDTELEPDYLPAAIPQLLINGSIGIAVGMATSIPPHNLQEVVNSIQALLKTPNLEIDDLLKYIQGPDFPTGAQFKISPAMIEGYKSGNGSVVVRAKTEIIDNEIIVSEIPYNINKTNLLSRIAGLVKDDVIKGVKDLRDESNYRGLKIVIELKKHTNPNLILNRLLKLTPLQSSFSFNFIALDKGQPRKFNLKQLLELYIDHRIEVIKRRTSFYIKKFSKKLFILAGLIIALQNIDKVIKLITASKTNNEARKVLMTSFDLAEEQAKAILEMRLSLLTGLEKDKLAVEAQEIRQNLANWKELLESEEKQKDVISKELDELKAKYPEERRTQISHEALDIREENLIEREKIFIIFTQNDYVKRVSEEDFKIQHRGGVGVTGISKKRDALKGIVSCWTHDKLLFFTNKGRVYQLKAYHILDRDRTKQGIPIINLINIDSDERVESVFVYNEEEVDEKYLLFVTTNGMVKKTKLSEYVKNRPSGYIGIKLKKGDHLKKVKLVKDNNDILLASRKGMVVRFGSQQITPHSRNSTGVRGIKLFEDSLVGFEILEKNRGSLVFITQQGYGKKTLISLFNSKNRALKGVRGIKFKNKHDELKATIYLTEDSDILIASETGKIIRINSSSISNLSRSAQGLKLISLNKTLVKDAVAII